MSTDLNMIYVISMYYFNKKANGFFIGVGKGSLSTDVTFTNLLFPSGLQSLIGSGSTELNLDTTNFGYIHYWFDLLNITYSRFQKNQIY